MLYKRKDPQAPFIPFTKLLTKWEEGNDNKFQVDFELYSKLSDAISSINQFTYCSFTDSSLVAFGDCGPTGAVINNAIGSDGISYL